MGAWAAARSVNQVEVEYGLHLSAQDRTDSPGWTELEDHLALTQPYSNADLIQAVRDYSAFRQLLCADLGLRLNLPGLDNNMANVDQMLAARGARWTTLLTRYRSLALEVNATRWDAVSTLSDSILACYVAAGYRQGGPVTAPVLDRTVVHVLPGSRLRYVQTLHMHGDTLCRAALWFVRATTPEALLVYHYDYAEPGGYTEVAVPDDSPQLTESGRFVTPPSLPRCQILNLAGRNNTLPTPR